jgi:lysophospholipase L1-like esterase
VRFVFPIAVAFLVQEAKPDRWEKEIRAFEEEDKKEKPPENGIVFVGSSSIRLWKTRAAFRDLPVINRGFGGSQIADAVKYADRLVLAYKPKVVVFFSGGNDLAAGKTPEQAFEDFKAFEKKLHDALPKARLLVLSHFSNIKRWNLDRELRRLNELKSGFATGNDLVTFINASDEMRNLDGTPRKELLLDDGLHLGPAGYAVWNRIAGPVIREAFGAK